MPDSTKFLDASLGPWTNLMIAITAVSLLIIVFRTTSYHINLYNPDQAPTHYEGYQSRHNPLRHVNERTGFNL